MSAEARPPTLTIITGMSGAGRSTAAKCLEDLGFFVIDNLPPSLIPKVVELGVTGTSPSARMALVTDVRGGVYFDELTRALDDLTVSRNPYQVLFLDAASEVLVRRFEEVRRPHPLSPEERVIDAIARERHLLDELRARADVVIDTSDLNVHELRREIRDVFGDMEGPTGLQISVISFGYKYGIPIDSDLVFDVRFLPNPHWVDDLRPLTGHDDPVRDYVMGNSATAEFIERLTSFLGYLMPAFVEEGKAHLTIAIGCTGGRHRSVVISEEVAQILAADGYNVRVRHRDIARAPKPGSAESDWSRPSVE